MRTERGPSSRITRTEYRNSLTETLLVAAVARVGVSATAGRRCADTIYSTQ